MELNPEKISVGFVSTIFCFFLAITPGYILIYFGSADLFLKLDNFRLSVLAIGITMPTIFFLTLVNALISNYFRKPKNGNSLFDSIQRDFMLSCAYSIMPYYITIFKLIEGRLPIKIKNIILNCSANMLLITVIIIIVNFVIPVIFAMINKTHNQSVLPQTPIILPSDSISQQESNITP